MGRTPQARVASESGSRCHRNHAIESGAFGSVRPVTCDAPPPLKGKSRVVTIIVAFLGLTRSGIVIGVAVQAATLALGVHR
jgi:hypothetical protein